MPVKSSDSADLMVLRKQLGAMRRKLWLERTCSLEAQALVVGLGVALAAVAVAWWWIVPATATMYGGPVAVAGGLALVFSLFRFPSASETARTADRRLGLRERLGTAVELSGSDSPSLFRERQLASAAEAAVWARLNWRGGTSSRRSLALAALFGLLIAGALALSVIEERLPSPIPRPSLWSLLPGDEPGLELPDDPQAAASQAAPNRPNNAASPRRRSAAARSLDELRRAREAGLISSQEAASRLGEAEADLAIETQDTRAGREALDRLGQALDQVAAGRPSLEAIEQGDYERAGREISSLGIESDQLSSQAKAQLAQALRSAAAETSNAPELTARERRAAEALTGREYEAARRALEDLGNEVARRGREVMPRDELGQAWERIAEERRAQGRSDGQIAARSEDGQGLPATGSQDRQARSGSPNVGSGAGNEVGAQSDDWSEGAGESGENVGPQTGYSPGEPTAGEFQPAGQAPRLESQGRSVEVDVKPGAQPGQRGGESDSPDGDQPNEQRLNEVGAISVVSGEAPRRVTSAAPPEANFVPSDRRQTVRDYFTSEVGGTR